METSLVEPSVSHAQNSTSFYKRTSLPCVTSAMAQAEMLRGSIVTSRLPARMIA